MEGSDNAPLDMHSAAEAFASLDGGESHEEKKDAVDPATDTPEAAAERLAAEDAAPKDEVTDVDAPADKFTIEVDGKNVELTKAEMAEHYKNGLRQADYTRKTMEAAEAKKSADAESTKARTERDDYAQKLNHYAIKINGDLQEQAALLTRELLDSDPMEYLRQKSIFEERQANLAKAQGELQQIGQQQQQEQADARKSYLEEQQAQLLAKLPDFKDPAKAKAAAAAIKEYLGGQGFAAGEADFTDHRAIVLAHKAMQYDALMQRAKDAVGKVAKLPTKVERSGTAEANRPDGRTTAMKRLKESGSINDAAAIFSQFMQ
jgi:hypothetical protein